MPDLLSGQQTKSQPSAQGLNNFLKLLNCCWNSQRVGSWIMFHEGLSSFGCSHCLGPLFGDRGRGMTMGNTAKIIHVTGLNCQVWDFAFPGGKRRGPGRAAQQDPGLCSSWGQEFELVQVQEPPAQDGHFQRVQGLEGMYWGDFTTISTIQLWYHSCHSAGRVSSSTLRADALLFSKCGMTKVLGDTAEACLSALWSTVPCSVIYSGLSPF